jgi:peptidoglycan/LPS O-acetylase OafA/YrhL
MSLFFVLSGFVIFYNYAESFAERPFWPALWDFVTARFARLYPLYALTLLMTISYLPSPIFAGDGMTALAYATLTQSWFNVQDAMFPPDWSISAEWFFYLVFIPLALGMIKLRPQHSFKVMIAFLAVAPIGIVIVLGVGKDAVLSALKPVLYHGGKVSRDMWDWLTYFSPYVRVLEFVAGVLAAKVFVDRRHDLMSQRSVDILVLCCAAWCVAVILTSGIESTSNLLTSNFIFAPAMALFLCYCPRSDGGIRKFLERPTLKFMGEISYSVYIWCWFAFNLMGQQFVSPSASPLAYLNSSIKLAVIVGITTVFAVGSYRVIEVPSRNWLRSRLRTRRAAPASALQDQAAAIVA